MKIFNRQRGLVISRTNNSRIKEFARFILPRILPYTLVACIAWFGGMYFGVNSTRNVNQDIVAEESTDTTVMTIPEEVPLPTGTTVVATPIGGTAMPQDATALPMIPNMTAVPVAPQVTGLPVIPNMPVPSLPQGVPTPAPATVEVPVQAVQVQAEKPKNNNIAVIANGMNTANGEIYNDGRIAYIGGDGIAFNVNSNAGQDDNTVLATRITDVDAVPGWDSETQGE